MPRRTPRRPAPRPARRRARTRAAALLLAAPALTACGFGAQTDQPYQPGVGANAAGDMVNVLGATVVVADPGQGTFSAGLVNRNLDESDELVGITGEGIQVELLEPLEIGPDSLLNLADTGAVLVVGEDLVAGSYARMTLQFASGESVDVNVPTVFDQEEFAEVVLAELPEEATAPADAEAEADAEADAQADAEAEETP